MLAAPAFAASYEWTFNSGNLSTSLGNGAMAFADAETSTITTFGTTGGGVPNIGGQSCLFFFEPFNGWAIVNLTDIFGWIVDFATGNWQCYGDGVDLGLHPLGGQL